MFVTHLKYNSHLPTEEYLECLSQGTFSNRLRRKDKTRFFRDDRVACVVRIV